MRDGRRRGRGRGRKSAPGDGDDGDDCGDVATRLAGFHEWIGAAAAGVGREAWVGTAGDQEAWVRRRGSTAGDQEAWVGTAGDQEAWVGTAGDDVVAEAHRWEGLLTPRMVRSAVEFCADAVDSGRYPWAAVTSWGFPEDPTRAPGASGCGELTFAVTPGVGTCSSRTRRREDAGGRACLEYQLLYCKQQRACLIKLAVETETMMACHWVIRTHCSS